MTEIKSRRIFFWSLILLFFVTAPLVILYSIGYRFSSQRGVFIYSGSATIKSNPSTVQIYLDHKPVSQNKVNFLNGSYHIDGIRPGEYLLEVAADGFNTWSKKVVVNSGVSTEFWNVLLTRNDYQRKSYNASPVEKFYPDPKQELIAVAQNVDGEQVIKIINISSLEQSTAFSTREFSLATNEKEGIIWSPQSHKVVIPVQSEDNKYYFIADVETKDTVNLKDIAGKDEINNVRWDPDKKDFVFYLSDNTLYQINLKNYQEKKIVAEDVSSYDLSGNYAYYLKRSNGIVYRSDSRDNNPNPLQITTSPLDVARNYKIIAYDEKRIALAGDGSLFIFNEGDHDNYFRELSNNAVDMQFSDDGKKLLFWNDWEIFVYFTRDWEVQPWRSENEQKEITRFSQKISNVQWSKDYEHVLFETDKKIKIAEIDNRYQLSLMDIIPLKADAPQISADFSNNKLYFTDHNEQGNIELYSIDFPENTGILGF